MKRVLQDAVNGVVDTTSISEYDKAELIKLYDEIRKANPNEVGRYVLELLYKAAEEYLREIEDGY